MAAVARSGALGVLAGLVVAAGSAGPAGLSCTDPDCVRGVPPAAVGTQVVAINCPPSVRLVEDVLAPEATGGGGPGC